MLFVSSGGEMDWITINWFDLTLYYLINVPRLLQGCEDAIQILIKSNPLSRIMTKQNITPNNKLILGVLATNNLLDSPLC